MLGPRAPEWVHVCGQHSQPMLYNTTHRKVKNGGQAQTGLAHPRVDEISFLHYVTLQTDWGPSMQVSALQLRAVAQGCAASCVRPRRQHSLAVPFILHWQLCMGMLRSTSGYRSVVVVVSPSSVLAACSDCLLSSRAYLVPHHRPPTITTIPFTNKYRWRIQDPKSLVNPAFVPRTSDPHIQ